MSQEIKEFNIRDLVLWTENPRDPVDANASDQDIADKAWENLNERWNLKKLAKEMRSHYDMSELPTVVIQGNKPIVFDGNRRMILAKLKHGIVNLNGINLAMLPDVPELIPCNVCSLDIAVLNLLRKHGDSGSWSPLDRDLFVHKYMREPKSIFQKLEEATSIISTNPKLNQVFVKKEIFSPDKLNELGLGFDGDNLLSRSSDVETKMILDDIAQKVNSKVITTRKNRGKVLQVLDDETKRIVSSNSQQPLKHITAPAVSTVSKQTPQLRQAARTKKVDQALFGGIIYLKPGQVSDLYRDISDLSSFYYDNKASFSQYFPSLIRMSLRLLAEAAASEMGMNMDDYLKSNFSTARSRLDKDQKTTLSSQNVRDTTITQHLHTGAHNYTSANNYEQTLAISIILGKILEISHGRKSP